MESITEDAEERRGRHGDDEGGGGRPGAGDELYDQAVALVARERKGSTSFVQRHLQIGYNRAATLIERMEKEGVVSQANHVGKREVLARNIDDRERCGHRPLLMVSEPEPGSLGLSDRRGQAGSSMQRNELPDVSPCTRRRARRSSGFS